jgi:predicted Zn-dependent protease with MMP-like domain
MQRIIIYREHHTDAESVRQTVLHEVGHYFGADEATVRGWGL